MYIDDYLQEEPENLETFLESLETNKMYIKNIIIDELEAFNIREFHDKYWSIKNENDKISDNDCYDKLRVHIFKTFFEVAKDNSFKSIIENRSEPSINKYLMNLLIEVMVWTDGYIKKLTKLCENVDIPKEGYQRAINASGLTRKLQGKQKILLDIYSNVIHKTVPILEGKPSDGKIIEKRNFIGFDSVDADLLFRLYLHGDKDVSPSSYYEVINGERDKHSFDKFVVWLWDWAQEQKPTPRVIPKELKLACAEILSIICLNNDQTKYTDKTFNVHSPDSAWKNFQQAVNDSKKRIKDF